MNAVDPGLIAFRFRITPRRPGPHSRKSIDQTAMTTGSIHAGTLRMAKTRKCRQKTPRT